MCISGIKTSGLMNFSNANIYMKPYHMYKYMQIPYALLPMFLHRMCPIFLHVKLLLKTIYSLDSLKTIIWFTNPFNQFLCQFHSIGLGGIKDQIINITKCMILITILHLWNHDCCKLCFPLQSCSKDNSFLLWFEVCTLKFLL